MGSWDPDLDHLEVGRSRRRWVCAAQSVQQLLWWRMGAIGDKKCKLISSALREVLCIRGPQRVTGRVGRKPSKRSL